MKLCLAKIYFAMLIFAVMMIGFALVNMNSNDSTQWVTDLGYKGVRMISIVDGQGCGTAVGESKTATFYSIDSEANMKQVTACLIKGQKVVVNEQQF